MPTITSLAEFRIELLRIFTATNLLTKLSAEEIVELDLRISSCALDYADGFYRDALRIKAN